MLFSLYYIVSILDWSCTHLKISWLHLRMSIAMVTAMNHVVKSTIQMKLSRTEAKMWFSGISSVNFWGSNINLFLYKSELGYLSTPSCTLPGFKPVSVGVFFNWRDIFTKQSVINADKLTSEISVHKALHWRLYHIWFQNKIELFKIL